MKRLMKLMALAISVSWSLGGVAMAAHVPESSCGGAGWPDCGGVHPAFSVGANSCNGLDACLNNTGDIAADSCNGANTCKNNDGDVAGNSCNGTSACLSNDGNVAENSCNGFTPCRALATMVTLQEVHVTGLDPAGLT